MATTKNTSRVDWALLQALEIISKTKTVTPRLARTVRVELLRVGFQLAYHGTHAGIVSTKLTMPGVGTVVFTTDTATRPTKTAILWRGVR